LQKTAAATSATPTVPAAPINPPSARSTRPLTAGDVVGARYQCDRGKELLKESEASPDTIVEAAQAFVLAAEVFERVGNENGATEANSFLYWCKKKMNQAQIQALIKLEDPSVATRLDNVVKEVPVEKAQAYLARADAFAAANPDEHLLIAIRYFEVADRFNGTEISLQALNRSFKEMQLAASTRPAAAVPPRKSNNTVVPPPVKKR
jgi:hypothetical protein